MSGNFAEIIKEWEATPGSVKDCIRKTGSVVDKSECEINGKSYQQNKPIIIDNHPNDSRVTISKSGNFQTLSSRMGTGGLNEPMIIGNGQSAQLGLHEISGTINCMHDNMAVIIPQEKIRRITPTECASLQGFPKWWCDGVPGYSDSAAYKMWGNGMALPCMLYVMEGLKQELEK